METALLYLEDSYLRRFEARVVAVDGQAVALDQTAFYPGGGGQMADRGTLHAGERAWRVDDVRKREQLVWHTLDEEPPPVGSAVVGEIDWAFRYQMMRTHTALHILCGILYHEFGSLVTGNQMYPDRARMDFSRVDMQPEQVRLIEEKVNEAVARNLPVSTRVIARPSAEQIPELIRTSLNLLPPDIQTVRIVEITGLDLQADGGTHVRATGEVGPVRVLKVENKGKANKRIEIALATSASLSEADHV